MEVRDDAFIKWWWEAVWKACTIAPAREGHRLGGSGVRRSQLHIVFGSVGAVIWFPRQRTDDRMVGDPEIIGDMFDMIGRSGPCATGPQLIEVVPGVATFIVVGAPPAMM